jgi:Ca-activated chloride channel homolog
VLAFQYTEILIALAVIPLLALLFLSLLHWKKTIVKKIGDERLVKGLIASYSPVNFLLKYILASFALIAIIIGIANPRKPGTMSNVNRKGVDVIIALDVSNSMLAQDIKPNRLERARQFVYAMMEELKNDRIGLVLFAGRAYMQMPLTLDHGAARMYVQTAGPSVVPTQGTVISEALRISNTAFNSKERKYKSIVLITDGEDHDPQALPLAQQMAENGVMINTIGIGSPEGSTIPDPQTGGNKTDETGTVVVSRLNEQELQQLAAATKGVYVRLENPKDAVRAVSNQLDTIEKTSPDDSAFKDYVNYFPWILSLALLILLVEFAYPERKFKLI